MKENVFIIRISGVLTIISILIYLIGLKENISLAIFGSALLSLIIALINYFILKRKVLEEFYKTIKDRIHFLTEYDNGTNLNEKCKFFIEYYNKDFSDYGLSYANIYFLFDFKGKNKKYIYDNIYCKTFNLSNTINNHYWNFRWYVDGTGKNDEAVKKMVKSIEKNMKIFMDKIPYEFENRYYKIMYGTKQYNKELKNIRIK